MTAQKSLSPIHDRYRLAAVVGACAVLVGGAIALTDAPVIAAALAVAAVALPLFLRASARVWLGLLVSAIAFDGLFKLVAWPSVWPQLLTPFALGWLYLRTLFVGKPFTWLRSSTIALLALGLLTVLCLLSMLVQTRSNVPAAAVGIYTWIAFAPLAWVGATLLETRNDLELATRWVLLLSLPVAIAAVIEYVLGATWYAGLGAGFAQATLGVAGYSGEGVFRVNGTLASPGHLAGFMIPVMFLSIVAFTSGGPEVRRAGVIGLVASSVTLFANNQRSWVVIGLVGLPLLYVLTKSMVRPGRWLRLATVAVGGLAVGAAIAGPGLVDRVLTIAVNPIQVIFGTTLGNYGVLKLASVIDTGAFLGQGPGTATIGARYFGPVWELTENYFANAYYELGPFGLLAIATMMLAVPASTIRAWMVERDPFVHTLLAAALVYQAAVVVLSISYSPLAYPPSAFFFWTSGGIAAARFVMASRDQADQETRMHEPADPSSVVSAPVSRSP